jgi:ketosteroid isomerase-like protein
MTPAIARGQDPDATDGQTENAAAVEQSADAAIHQELRALREELTEAVLARDMEKQLQYAHPNVVVTWQNNDVVRGRDGLQEYMQRMNVGDIFQGYKVRPTADEPTILYGENFGVVFGKSVPHYKIAGMEFDLENRWTATLVRENDGWRLAAYHVSGNVLDNAVLEIAKRSVYWVGGIAFAVGLVVGLGVAVVLGRRRRGSA